MMTHKMTFELFLTAYTKWNQCQPVKAQVKWILPNSQWQHSLIQIHTQIWKWITFRWQHEILLSQCIIKETFYHCLKFTCLQIWSTNLHKSREYQIISWFLQGNWMSLRAVVGEPSQDIDNVLRTLFFDAQSFIFLFRKHNQIRHDAIHAIHSQTEIDSSYTTTNCTFLIHHLK